MRRGVSLLLALSVLVVGCSAPARPSASAPGGGGATVSVAPSDSGLETGTISGRVADDEARPVPGATLLLRELNVQAFADSEGRFRFQSVPVGRHSLIAASLGYGAHSRVVEVKAGEETPLLIELEALVVGVPRHVALPHTFYIHLGFYGTSFAGGNTTSCQQCEWIPKIQAGPSYALVEIKGKHAVKHPTKPDGLALFIYKRHKTGASGGYIQYCDWIGTNPDVPCLRLPMRLGYNQTYLEEVEPKGAMAGIRLWQWCDPFWVCVEERYDEWLTLFYDTPEADVPQNYTAWPPS